MEQDSYITPKTRPQTRSRTLSTGGRASTSEKRKRSPDQVGNMSKKSSAEHEPSNALIMRAITNMNSKYDKLPTVEHLNKLEADLHAKIERNGHALKSELRAEFKADMDAQAQKMTQMVAEVRAQVSAGQLSAGAAVRNDQQKGRYLRARRSFKIWPVEKEPS